MPKSLIFLASLMKTLIRQGCLFFFPSKISAICFKKYWAIGAFKNFT